MRGLGGVLLGGFLASLIACAMGSHKATVAPAAPGPQPMPSERHGEIDELEQQIASERARLDLPAPVEPMAVTPACPGCATQGAERLSTPPPYQGDPACHPAANETCTRSCTLSDSICGNADKICKIADQLAGDTWAAGKCHSSETTCKSAHDKCCSCQ